MQQGSDLVGAGYPTSRPLTALLGGASNVYQPNVPVATNLDFGLVVSGAGVALGGGTTGNVACVPVVVGTAISRVSALLGGIGSGGNTHSYAALYSGTAIPALLGQSVDTAAVAYPGANARQDYTLAAPVTLTPQAAPFGFVYVVVFGVQATTQATVISVATPTGVYYPWFPNSPAAIGATAAVGVTTAPATISLTAFATAPVVLLS